MSASHTLANISTLVHYDSVARVWVSYCTERDIFSQGGSREEAIVALDAARKTYDRVMARRSN